MSSAPPRSEYGDDIGENHRRKAVQEDEMPRYTVLKGFRIGGEGFGILFGPGVERLKIQFLEV